MNMTISIVTVLALHRYRDHVYKVPGPANNMSFGNIRDEMDAIVNSSVSAVFAGYVVFAGCAYDARAHLRPPPACVCCVCTNHPRAHLLTAVAAAQAGARQTEMVGKA